MKPLCFEVSGEAPSAPNLREHPMARARRVRAQRDKVRRRMQGLEQPAPAYVVRLTRVAPRRLDDDNLRGALKAYRDQVACWLGVDDKGALVRWEYEQQKGPTAVRIEVLPAGPLVLEEPPVALPQEVPDSSPSSAPRPTRAPRQRSLEELATSAYQPPKRGGR